jgi:hypothetical protein
MPSFTGKTFSSFYKNLLGMNQSSNTGVDATTRNIQDGAGNNSSLSLSDDVLSVQPVNDDSSGTILCKTKSGSTIFSVDTTNSKVLVGASRVAANTQYAHFGVSSTAALSAVAGTHYLIPFGNMLSSTVAVAFGAGTDPETSYDVSTHNNADDLTSMLWYLPDDITLDAVHLFAGGNAASGDTINIHLMSFDIDQGSGAGKGDLSNGAVVVSGADIASLGYENIIYQTTAPSTADVDAGKVILATFESAGTNSDYSCNITVKYHIR